MKERNFVMGKLEDRENRRRASVVGSIAGVEEDTPHAHRGRPKETRETKKRVSLSVLPSLYEDIQKIAYIKRRSVSDLLTELMEQYRQQHLEEIEEFRRIQ